MTIEKDDSFLLAERYVLETGVSVFLTGKAGTGKTTFLKSIISSSTKRCAVVAPTGVAAINAGGVTIHSFFQLPLCPYLPDVKELVTEYQTPEKYRGLKKERIKILRTLDLLIIDEISMVRADILDAIDSVLRRYRRDERPFGGLQLLMIGDIQQLPPVLKDSERKFFEQVYPSPFFFNSKALQKLDYIVIELQKVHRQSDALFLEILNDVRSGHPSPATLKHLNSRLDPSFVPPDGEKWIRLTTHNAQADNVNSSKLAALKSEQHEFSADIEGTFPENAYPADMQLRLKVGAQVMFIRNDTSGAGRYYNGKIGTVSDIGEGIIVTDEAGRKISVAQEEWDNVRYELSDETGEIVSAIDGKFRQYPLRLAWAVTIHKSQGLTFDRVMIDAGAAFSFGQVYVALSRCRTLEGIVLCSPITSRCTFSNDEVRSFESGYTPQSMAGAQLESCRASYFADTLCEAFNLKELRYRYNRVNRIYQVGLSNLYPAQAAKFRNLAEESDSCAGIKALSDIAARFQLQVRSIIGREGRDSAFLKERVLKAAEYFSDQIATFASVMVPLLMIEIDSKETKKDFNDKAKELLREILLRRDIYASVVTKGFSTDEYHRISTASELADISIKKASRDFESEAEESRDIYSDNRHPEVVTALMAWRTEKYRELEVPAYMVLSQKALLGIADAMPSNKAELLDVKGFGKLKWEAYGEEILEILSQYRER